MPQYIPDPGPRTPDPGSRTRDDPGPRTARGTPRKTPADIRETFHRRRLRLEEVAHIDDCKRLCALWHNEFGACLTLDTQRLRALLNRLRDFAVEQLGFAILAYHAECDTYQGKFAGLHKTLIAFLYDDKLEEYVTRGEALAQKQRAAHGTHYGTRSASKRHSPESSSASELLATWQQLPPADRRALLDQAVKELELRAPLVGARDERNPIVRGKVAQLMQRRAKGQTPTLGDAVTEALS